MSIASTTFSSTSSSSSPFRFSLTTSTSSNKTSIIIRCSNTSEGPLRRPIASREPSLSLKPVAPSPSPPPPPPPPSSQSLPLSKQVTGVSQISTQNVVSMEFQRKIAKDLQEYFRKKKLEEANQGPFFGFINKNEISNGRWAMFGFAVGLLTEYATGSDFVDQLKILLSNFGIIDLD